MLLSLPINITEDARESIGELTQLVSAACDNLSMPSAIETEQREKQSSQEAENNRKEIEKLSQEIEKLKVVKSEPKPMSKIEIRSAILTAFQNTPLVFPPDVETSLVNLECKLMRTAHTTVEAKRSIVRAQSEIMRELDITKREVERLSPTQLTSALDDMGLVVAPDSRAQLIQLHMDMKNLRKDHSDLRNSIEPMNFEMNTHLGEDLSKLFDFFQQESTRQVDKIHQTYLEHKKMYKQRLKDKFRVKSENLMEAFASEREAILQVVKYECSEILSDAKSLFAKSHQLPKNNKNKGATPVASAPH